MNGHERHLIALLVELHIKLMGAKWSSVSPEEIRALPAICDQLEARADQVAEITGAPAEEEETTEPEAETDDVAPPPSEAPRVAHEPSEEAGDAALSEIVNCWCGLQISVDILHFPSNKPRLGEEHYASRVKPTEQEEESADGNPSGD